MTTPPRRPPPPVGGKPFQSKLEPFTEVIRRLRRQRKTYPAIARILAEEHGVKAAASTIFEFVKVRARRPHGVYALPEPAPSPPVTTATAPIGPPARADAATPTTVPRKFVFEPKPKTSGPFRDEDLEFNDPLR